MASPNRAASPIEEELKYAMKQTPSRPIYLFVREAVHRDDQLDVMLRQPIVGETMSLSKDDDVAFQQVSEAMNTPLIDALG
jgi:hypothetical protein